MYEKSSGCGKGYARLLKPPLIFQPKYLYASKIIVNYILEEIIKKNVLDELGSGQATLSRHLTHKMPGRGLKTLKKP
ncbi:MAG: hypothetical protein JSV56_07880 [Methanomassiliicoccales archaeon]|nr:MAG: hypothetical protein JSV56_07880 [Methanomassiliicoccales archaeon]